MSTYLSYIHGKWEAGVIKGMILHVGLAMHWLNFNSINDSWGGGGWTCKVWEAGADAGWRAAAKTEATTGITPRWRLHLTKYLVVKVREAITLVIGHNAHAFHLDGKAESD